MTINYNEKGLDLTIDALLLPDPNGGNWNVVRYGVQVNNLHTNEGSTVVAINLYHNPAYDLLKWAGVPWREANNLLNLAYVQVVTTERVS